MKRAFGRSDRRWPAAVLFVTGWLCVALAANAAGPVEIPSDLSPVDLALVADREPPVDFEVRDAAPCVGGLAAGTYPCNRVDLAAVMPLASIGAAGGNANDIWGWTDPLTDKEYALVGLSTGTAFVDISTPDHPTYLGLLPTHSSTSLWRSLKVYADHVFVVSEAIDHGMQVFDLTTLRGVTSPPVTFSETAHYAFFGRAHTLAMNEDTGFAYAAGSRQGTQMCNAGLHMVDVSTPDAPVFAGCVGSDGYTHETQCVTYHGPDAAHAGDEICLSSNEDTLTIIDVNNKAAPVQLSRTGYTGSGYTHQGWLTEDHVYFLLDDELDESNFGHDTRTYVWDVSDLEAPVIIGRPTNTTPAIDHNQYVKGGFLYQANYRSGLRILSLEDVAAGELSEVAFFDVYPANDNPSFNGSWSVFPFFDSGTVIVGGIEQGLFVLTPRLCDVPAQPADLAATPAGDNQIDLAWNAPGVPAGTRFEVERSFGACPGSTFQTVASGLSSTAYSDTTVAGSVTYSYRVTAEDATGLCVSPASACDDAVTTGPCNAPPIFAGLTTISSPPEATCSVDLGWDAADPNCSVSATYSVYRSTAPGFTPSPANRVATGLTSTTYRDATVAPDTQYFYVVRATDAGNGIEDGNAVELAAAPIGPFADGTWAAGAEVGDPPLDGTSGPFRHVGWEPSTDRVHGGGRSYFSTYGASQCSALSTREIGLTAGQSPSFSFWTLHEIEPGDDGGTLEISSDGGATWAPLTLTPDYPATMSSSADTCGFATGRPAFSGADFSWGQHTANLSAFAGDTVMIRFLFSTDASTNFEGWYLDDLALTHAQVPGTCSAAPIFEDGFETGDASAWSLVVGG